MKIGGRDVPTPLVVGGIAGVGMLVIGQRLTGQAPTPAGDAAAVADPAAAAAGGGAGGSGDLWNDAAIGQFPSFVPSSGGGAAALPADPGSGGWGYWDDEAPPVAAPSVNTPAPSAPVSSPLVPGATPVPIDTVAPAAPTSGAPRPSGAKPSSAVAGWAYVSGVQMFAMWGSWTTYPGPVSGLRAVGMTGSRYVSTPRTVYFGSDPAKRQFSVRRVADTAGNWTNWFVPAGITVRTS